MAPGSRPKRAISGAVSSCWSMSKALDARQFVLTGVVLPAGAWPLAREPHFFETSRPGIFAVGDVRSGSVKRVAAAVGEGAAAVQSLHQVLSGQLAARL
jgi:thioredoxin reductase (NADPH)